MYFEENNDIQIWNQNNKDYWNDFEQKRKIKTKQWNQNNQMCHRLGKQCRATFAFNRISKIASIASGLSVFENEIKWYEIWAFVTIIFNDLHLEAMSYQMEIRLNAIQKNKKQTTSSEFVNSRLLT